MAVAARSSSRRVVEAAAAVVAAGRPLGIPTLAAAVQRVPLRQVVASCPVVASHRAAGPRREGAVQPLVGEQRQAPPGPPALRLEQVAVRVLVLPGPHSEARAVHPAVQAVHPAEAAPGPAARPPRWPT